MTQVRFTLKQALVSRIKGPYIFFALSYTRPSVLSVVLSISVSSPESILFEYRKVVSTKTN